MPRRHFTSLALALSLTFLQFESSESRPVIYAAATAPGSVVISQIFGGGGNSGAPFQNDFVELFNRSTAPVSLSGYSIQYISATGSSTWSKTDLAGTISPGQYFLIQLAGGSTGAPLPAPDASGALNLAATAGKVALVNSTATLSGACPSNSSITDLAGYGATASCFEGSGPAPAPSATRAVIRAADGCTDTDDNQSDFSAVVPAPRNSASPLRPCHSTPVEGARITAEDIRINIGNAPSCSPFPGVVHITNSGTGAQRDNTGPEAVFTFPVNTMIADAVCRASTGECAAVNASRIEWNGAIGAGETLTIEFDFTISSSVAPGQTRCIETTVNYDANDDGVNESSTTVSACATANCPATGPGTAIAASVAPDSSGPGSVLVFPFYTSSAAGAHAENTRLSLTNTHPHRAVVVHLFFIAEDSPQVADAFLCLTPNQTRSFLASDIDPNVAGYVIAAATDEATGCPINFNYLIGDAYIKLASGHTAGIAAESFAAIASTPVACTPTSITAEIRFDGVNFSAAPRTLALDGIPSPGDPYDMILVVDRLGGNLLTGASTIGQVAGLLYNDAEQAFSFEWNTSRRQFRSRISSAFPRTAPRLDVIIPRGSTGWMKFWRTADGAILGLRLTAHAGGSNLKAMKLTAAATLIVPLIPPKC